MKKTDPSIHKICVAAIKRSLMVDAELNFTQIHEGDTHSFPFDFEFFLTEIPICSTIKDKGNWSILTTQRLVSKLNNQLFETDMETSVNRFYGDFKGYKDKDFTFGKVENLKSEEIQYLIETGKSSMVMVQGVKTRIDIQQNTEQNNQTRINRWKKRGLIE